MRSLEQMCLEMFSINLKIIFYFQAFYGVDLETFAVSPKVFRIFLKRRKVLSGISFS